MAKIKRCRNCKSFYKVPGIMPGVCSIQCYEIRHGVKIPESKIFKRPPKVVAEPWYAQKKYQSLIFYESRAWQALRYQTLRKYGHRCMSCGVTQKEKIIQIDHIKPISTHPELKLDPNNLQVLCRDCNLGKSNKDETNFTTLG